LPPITTLFNLGMAYYEARRHADSIRVLERAVARVPENAAIHALLAADFAQLGRPADAARERDALKRVSPFFDIATFGSRFQNPAHRAYLTEGLAKAGLT
jgi:adenylate cyclase